MCLFEIQRLRATAFTKTRRPVFQVLLRTRSARIQSLNLLQYEMTVFHSPQQRSDSMFELGSDRVVFCLSWAQNSILFELE